MKKLLFIAVIAAMFGCADDDIITGTAVSFYPKIVDAVVEGGSTTATLELTGPGSGSVVISVNRPEFITTVPAMVNGKLELTFNGETSQSFQINVARGSTTGDYLAEFSVESVSGGIEDIGTGTFKLFVTTVPTVSLPFFDDFEDCSEEFATPDKWVEAIVTGAKLDRGWGCRATDGLNSTRGVRASGFGGEAGTENAWLVTKGSLNFSTVSEAYLKVDIKSNFSGDGDLFLKWSENYSGAGDPSAATWNEIPTFASQLPAKGSGAFKAIAVDLNMLVGKNAFIAFQYIGASNSSSASYEMDNVSISDDGSGFENFNLPYADDLNSCSNFAIPSNFVQVRTEGSKLDRGWACNNSGVSNSQAVRATALGGVAGTVDAWLISAKPFDLSAVTAANLNFDIKSATDGAGALKVLWSTTYDGNGTINVAQWTEFTGVSLPTGGSNSFESIAIDLADALGSPVYVAFQFVGATNSSSISYDVDNIEVSSEDGNGGGGGGSDITDAGDCNLTGTGTIIVSHDFEGCSENFATPSGFIEVFGAGSKTDRGWGCRDDGTDESRGVRASAFGGQEGFDDAWLIMDPFNADSHSEISLKFDVQSPFDGPGDLFVLYSNNYSGSGDPAAATWTQLENVADQLPAKGASEFATVITSPCDMTGTQVYIAFQYVNGTSSASAAWSIDNVELRGN